MRPLMHSRPERNATERNASERIRSRRERGAIVSIVAVLFGGAVLMGSGAVVVDVGQLYAEREELQSGADAAAAALVNSCAADVNSIPCRNYLSAAKSYADRNARDDRSAVGVVCGRGYNLPACPAPTGNLTGCIGPRPDGEYVEVRTSTQLRDGSTLLPPAFARTFAGREAFQGTTVAACARARATPGGVVRALPAPAITIERCYHTNFTSNGTNYSAVERPLYLKNGPGDPCNGTSSTGANGPGNFGWLDHDGDCQSPIDLDTAWVGGDTGNNADSDCVELLDSYIDSQTPMALPLFDASTGQGSKFEYEVVGISAFVVTGYQLSGKSRVSRISTTHLCTDSNARCLYGYFVQATMPATRSGGGTDYGLTAPGGAKIIG